MNASNHNKHHGLLHTVNERLEQFSRLVTHWSGSSWGFALAVGVVIVWIVSGPIFSFSDTWQLVINTGTTIVTFLMVFLIQRSQNKDALAIQIKLNELLASQQGASNRLINVEDLSEEEISELHSEFGELSRRLAASVDGDGSPHSVSEAHRAVADAQETLERVRRKSGDRKKHGHQRNGHQRHGQHAKHPTTNGANAPTSDEKNARP